MPDWTTIVWALGWVYSTWRLGGALAWSFKFGRDPLPRGDDIAMGLVVGAMLAIAWPLALPGAILVERGKSGKFLYTPREEKLKLQQRRIQELEEQLEVGKYAS